MSLNKELNTKKYLSIVIPVYNEENIVGELVRQVNKVRTVICEKYHLSERDIEVIYVNDGSRDGTLPSLEKHLGENDSIINLSRNHGHQLAITAGIDASVGDAVVLIDGDLQDPPEFIFNLYEKYREGFDVVFAIRRSREGETAFKLLTASLFYRTFRWMTNINLPMNTGDFRIMSRRVADILSSMREPDRFIRGLTCWIGFKQTGLEYDRKERFSGNTKYTLFRMIKFSFDAITSFSGVPLRLVSIFGLLVAFGAFIAGLVVIYLKLFTNTTIVGWASLLTIVLFMGGVQLIAIGVMGEYLKRVSDQIKFRPLYIVDQIIHGKKA
jgi:dolichol-phosphate mannosyltransferase